jgi:hypothetical protein
LLLNKLNCFLFVTINCNQTGNEGNYTIDQKHNHLEELLIILKLENLNLPLSRTKHEQDEGLTFLSRKSVETKVSVGFNLIFFYLFNLQYEIN